jgi:hypothetical protein
MASPDEVLRNRWGYCGFRGCQELSSVALLQRRCPPRTLRPVPAHLAGGDPRSYGWPGLSGGHGEVERRAARAGIRPRSAAPARRSVDAPMIMTIPPRCISGPKRPGGIIIPTCCVWCIQLPFIRCYVHQPTRAARHGRGNHSPDMSARQTAPLQGVWGAESRGINVYERLGLSGSVEWILTRADATSASCQGGHHGDPAMQRSHSCTPAGRQRRQQRPGRASAITCSRRGLK